jgi:hypothetical protein
LQAQSAALGRSLLAAQAHPAAGAEQTRSARRPKRPIDPAKQLYRLAEAARILGVDLKTTLADLIARKAIRTIPGPRGPRIPRREIDRLLDEGIPDLARVHRSARARRQALSDVAGAIRKLPVR